MTYSLNDICLTPAKISRVEHRGDCNPYNVDQMLPLFTAPMNSIVDENNYETFLKNKINTIIPRGVDYGKRLELSTKTFVALGLDEFESFISDCPTTPDSVDCTYYICVDVANGHMKRLIDLCSKAKVTFGSHLILMAGNIANPETYADYAIAGVDFIRVGIGGGSACFVEDTNISMADGSVKKISEVSVNDIVKTVNGPKKVINTFKKTTGTTVVINDNIECTLNHKFLVINKLDKDKITENNLMDYAFYVEASNLNDSYLLVKDNNV